MSFSFSTSVAAVSFTFDFKSCNTSLPREFKVCLETQAATQWTDVKDSMELMEAYVFLFGFLVGDVKRKHD